MDTKICCDCKEAKDTSEFYIQNNKTRGTSSLSSYCKVCDRSRAKEAKLKYAKKYQADKKERLKVDPEYREHIRKQKRENSRKNIQATMLAQARNRANRKGIEFDIDVSDIIIPDICPLLKVPFILGTKEDYLYTPSLDRLDSTKGYVKGNVRVITMLANSMKNVANNDQLLTFAQNINEYLNN